MYHKAIFHMLSTCPSVGFFPKQYFFVAVEPTLKALRKPRGSLCAALWWGESNLGLDNSQLSENGWKQLKNICLAPTKPKIEGPHVPLVLLGPLGCAWWRKGSQISWINRFLLTEEKCKCTLQSVCADIKCVCNPGLWNGGSYSVR